ncbi:hypothetical protein MBLNU230_g8459t1 [Neophaeotheca triangularis]
MAQNLPIRSAAESAAQKTNGASKGSHGATMAESEPSTPSRQQDKIVVGLDFGTTYSGVAFTYSATPEDIDIIKAWPGGNGITSDKVPSEVAYELVEQPNGAAATTPRADLTPEQLNHTATLPRQIRWGFQFKPEEPRLRCIKLFLDRNQKLPHFVSPLETATALRKYDRTVMDAVSDYLTKVYEHTMETLKRRFGESFIASTPIEFILTVPAVWSDAAKNATLQAAERAGMGERAKLQLISEPEAAAVHTLKTMQPGALKVGSNFVVCDAGGGTVDLIAYKVTQLSPLRVEESAVGTGGLCGSAFLNYRFEEHVKQRLGMETYTMMREKKPKTWMMGLKYFEEFIKRNFNEEEHSEVNVPFPGLPDNEEAGLDSGFLIMTAAQVKSIFDPVIKEVIQLVEGQVNAIKSKGGAVSGIILVGGFGQSNYLYTRLKDYFNVSPPPPYSETPTHELGNQQAQSVEVLQPMNAWTSVVRGAVLKGVEGNMVEKRRSRWHYGTSYATVFDEAKHPVSDRYWSPLWERWMVSDRMQWHIAKGTPISSETPISFHYTRNFRPGQSLVVEDDLIGTDLDEPPDAYSKSLTDVCTLTTDLNAVPKTLFTRLTTTKGVEFDNLDFELHMKIESANLVFELRVDGVKYGSVKADFH